MLLANGGEGPSSSSEREKQSEKERVSLHESERHVTGGKRNGQFCDSSPH